MPIRKLEGAYTLVMLQGLNGQSILHNSIKKLRMDIVFLFLRYSGLCYNWDVQNAFVFDGKLTYRVVGSGQ